MQYNPVLAVSAIENTQEVKAAMHRLGVRPVQTLAAQLLIQPAPGLPHLRSSIKDITVDQALDLIAETFNGIVVYGACGDLFRIDFADMGCLKDPAQTRPAMDQRRR